MPTLAARCFGTLRIVAVILLASSASVPQALADSPSPDLSTLAATLMPSVVTIQTTATTPHGRMYFDGSGFIIEPSGIIVTNRHVITGAYQIMVTIPGMAPLRGKPLFISSMIDIALLKVDAGRPLPTVRLGDSDTVKIGDPVMLIGNPLGIGESLSVGTVSALNRNISETMYDHFIQTDAALNHGNSGGAMFNRAGEVIGIDTGLISSPNNTGSIGLGFALPINDAKFIFDQFLKTGNVIYGTVGVHGQPVTRDLADAFGMPVARGAIVTGVDADSPAAGKIRLGDVVLNVSGQDATDTRAVARLIATTAPGQDLQVTLLREGREVHVSVQVARGQYDPKKGFEYLGHAMSGGMMAATPLSPGMKLAKIDGATRRQFMLDTDQQGVVVSSVDEHGVAANRKIVAGDVILSIGGTPVNSPDEVVAQLHAVVAAHRPFAALLIAGERSTRWVALPVAADR